MRPRHPTRLRAARAAGLLAAVTLAGCLTAHPPLDGRATPRFEPEVFFDGATSGLGTLDVRGRGRQLVRVASRGRTRADGTFKLDQTIAVGDDAPYTRTWTMRRTGPDAFVSSLSDAAGPVELATDGATLRVRYRLGRFTTMHQRLVLQPDGQTALNVATVRVLGVPVARLTEIITRASPPPARDA